MAYAVVNFLDFNQVAIVSTRWYNDDYLKAISKEAEALENSEIHTADDEGTPMVKKKRLRKPNRKYTYSESDEESDKQPVMKHTNTCPISPSNLPTPPAVLDRSSFGQDQNDAELVSPSTSLFVATPALSQASQPAGNNASFITDRDVHILTAIEELKSSMKSMMTIQNTILRHVQMGAVAPSEEMPEEISLPLTTMEQVDELERQLNDPMVQRCLQRKLTLIGGVTMKDTVRRTLRQLVTNTLAQQFTWRGFQGKRAFQQLKLKQTMFKALRQNLDTKSSTDSQMETAAIDWFRYAKDRNGGRKKRMEKAAAVGAM